MRRMFLVLMLLVLMISVVGSTQYTQTHQSSGYSFSNKNPVSFNDNIDVVEAGDRIIIRDTENKLVLNVNLEGSQFLNNFNLMLDNQEDYSKFSYEFRLPSDDYKFNVTIHGTVNNLDSYVSHRENSPVFRFNGIRLNFEDFYDMGLEGYPIRIGNIIYYNFEPDWNELGYSAGDMVLLDPLIEYDFGGVGGVFASRCQGGAVTPDDSVFYQDPCPNDFLIITDDTDLDTSDDNEERIINSASTDQGFALFFFNVSNFTGTIRNMTFSWEGQQQTSTDPVDIRVYNYDNTSWVTCETFEPAGVGSDETHTCELTSSGLTQYLNESVGEDTTFVSFALYTSNDDPDTCDIYTDYIFLSVGDYTINGTFIEANSQPAYSKYLNLTFRYETNNSYANGSIDASFSFRPIGTTFDYTTSNYQDPLENTTISFTYIPNNLNITNEMTILYENHGSQTRTYSDTLTLTNHTYGTTEKTLYLLPSAEGIYVTFQVIDVSENPIDDVLIKVNRSVSGTNTEIQSGTTGSAGTSSFFLDPDIVHTFVFSKTGYNTLTSTFAPTQSLYTVTLGSSTSVLSNQTNRYQGITYEFYPDFYDMRNGTFYNFSFYVSSSFHALDRVGYRLYNGTGHFLYNNTCVGVVTTGCNITTDTRVNTGLNTTIIMNAFWDIDGNVTNVTRTWAIFTVDNSTGISSFTNLRKDIEHLTSAFGGGRNADFTKGIISFMIILFGTAGICYRSGQFSPLAITIYMFGLTVFLDLIGMLPTLTGEWGGINGITILIGIIVLIVFISDQKI